MAWMPPYLDKTYDPIDVLTRWGKEQTGRHWCLRSMVVDSFYIECALDFDDGIKDWHIVRAANSAHEATWLALEDFTQWLKDNR